MSHILQLQILQTEEIEIINSTEKQIEQKNLPDDISLIIPNLNQLLDFCFKDGKYYLMLSDQLISLQNGALLKGKNFNIKVLPLTKSTQTINEDTEITINDQAKLAEKTLNIPNQPDIATPDFAIAELNRENSFLELSTLAQMGNPNDELAFLFTNGTNVAAPNNALLNSTYPLSEMLLSGTDPLSLLNQHFQPPEAKVPSTPEAIGMATEIISKPTVLFNEGNILHDLGFLTISDKDSSSIEYNNLLPAQYNSILTIGYRDDSNEPEIKALESMQTNEPTTTSTIKRLWQKFLTNN